MLYRQDFGDRPQCDEPNCYRDAQIMKLKKDGTPIYRKHNGKHKCDFHHKEKYNMRNTEYLKHRKNYCENAKGPHKGWLIWECNVVDVDPRFLTIDHSDGDHENNDPENCMTLCPFCHVIKTNIFDSGWRNKSQYETNRDHHAIGLAGFMEATEEEIASINKKLNSAK